MQERNIWSRDLSPGFPTVWTLATAIVRRRYVRRFTTGAIPRGRIAHGTCLAEPGDREVASELSLGLAHCWKISIEEGYIVGLWEELQTQMRSGNTSIQPGLTGFDYRISHPSGGSRERLVPCRRSL